MSCSSCSFPGRYPISTIVIAAGSFLTAAFLAHLVFKASADCLWGIGITGFASTVFVALIVYRMKSWQQSVQTRVTASVTTPQPSPNALPIASPPVADVLPEPTSEPTAAPLPAPVIASQPPPDPQMAVMVSGRVIEPTAAPLPPPAPVEVISPVAYKPSAQELRRRILAGDISGARACVTPEFVRCENPAESSVLDEAIKELLAERIDRNKPLWHQLICEIDQADPTLRNRPNPKNIDMTPLSVVWYTYGRDLDLSNLFGMRESSQLYNAISSNKPVEALQYVTANSLKIWLDLRNKNSLDHALKCCSNDPSARDNRPAWLALIQKIHQTDGALLVAIRDDVVDLNDAEINAILGIQLPSSAGQ